MKWCGPAPILDEETAAIATDSPNATMKNWLLFRYEVAAPLFLCANRQRSSPTGTHIRNSMGSSRKPSMPVSGSCDNSFSHCRYAPNEILAERKGASARATEPTADNIAGRQPCRQTRRTNRGKRYNSPVILMSKANAHATEYNSADARLEVLTAANNPRATARKRRISPRTCKT